MRTPNAHDVELAAANLHSTIRQTPLTHSPRLGAIRGADVYLKREDLQIARSYKSRGAYNFISSLTASERDKGVVCASAGNHAQGVAFACRQLHTKGKVFLPSTTPRQKRSRIADIGGEWIEQIIGGATFDEASSASKEYAIEHGATYVHPFDDARTIAGQGTAIREVFTQMTIPPDAVVIPVGGGGLLAGTAVWLKERYPHVKLYGVEPDGAASMTAALAAGEPVTLDRVDAFVDGTAVGRVGDTSFPIVRELVDEVITVPEGAVCTEMIELYQVDGVIAEPAGALASAAVATGLIPGAGTVIAFVSGGNNDISRYDEIIERSLVHEGLRHYFLVTFPQEPGALRHFLDDVLTDGEDIVLFEYTKKNNRETGPALVGIEIDKASRISSLLDRMGSSNLQIEKLEPDSPEFTFLL